MAPTFANGKVCHLEIRALDVQRSADFYAQVFGWRLRKRGNGRLAFDDTTGEVSGTWVVGRPPSAQPGLLVYVMSTAWPRPSTPSWPTVAPWCSLAAQMRPR